MPINPIAMHIALSGPHLVMSHWHGGPLVPYFCHVPPWHQMMILPWASQTASKVFLVERVDGGACAREFYAVKVWRRSRLTRVSTGVSQGPSAGLDAVMRELSLWSGLACDRCARARAPGCARARPFPPEARGWRGS